MPRKEVEATAVDELLFVWDGDPQIVLVCEYFQDLLERLGFEYRYPSVRHWMICGDRRKSGRSCVVDVELGANGLSKCRFSEVMLPADILVRISADFSLRWGASGTEGRGAQPSTDETLPGKVQPWA